MVIRFFILLAFLLLAGCSFLPHFLYKINVQQGNVVTEEMLEKLKPGMTKSQVRFVMGSPLIIDAFRDNRWDYVYLLREGGNLVEQKRLTIFFEDDKLVNIENYLQFSNDLIKSRPTEINPDKEKAKSDDGERK